MTTRTPRLTAFVSMPFGDHPDSKTNEWKKLFEYGLKPLEADELQGLPEGVVHSPIKLWRADRNLESLALKTNVIRGLERSAFMICVLTTSLVRGHSGLRLTNPNVLWELGYAEAIGKPVVILADNNDLRNLPILAGVPNVCVYDHHLVQRVRWEDAPTRLLPIATNLVQHVTQAIQEVKRGTARSAGSRARFYASRDVINLQSMIGEAQQQVDILTTNLDYFVSDKLSKHSGAIGSALDNGATVRIVTMDPESVIAEYRARQLVRGQDIPGYRRELRNGIVRLFQVFGDHPHFHLHIYNDLPLQITTRVDHTVVTSVVTRGERARKRIQIQFNLNDDGVTESFVSHFQSMFDNSIDVTSMNWVLKPITEAPHARRDTNAASKAQPNNRLRPSAAEARKSRRG